MKSIYFRYVFGINLWCTNGKGLKILIISLLLSAFSQAFHTPILLFGRISFCCRSVELFIRFCSEYIFQIVNYVVLPQHWHNLVSRLFPEIGNPAPELKSGKLIIPWLQVPFSLWGLLWLQGVCLTPFHQNKIILYCRGFEHDPFRKGTFVLPLLIIGRCVQIFDSLNEHNYQLSSIHWSRLYLLSIL